MCIPDFDAIRDKRMSELTPEQKEDSRELWLRENVAWMGDYHTPLYTLLIKRLDAARAAYKDKVGANQKLACDLLTAEAQAAGEYGDVSVTTLEKMRKTMTNLGIATDEGLEMFGLRLEDNLLYMIQAVDHFMTSVREMSEDHADLVRKLDVTWNGAEGAAKQASLCGMVCQISKELPELRNLKLDKPAMVGRGRFGVGVSWSTVIGAAQRLYEYEVTPEKEAARIKRATESIALAGPSLLMQAFPYPFPLRNPDLPAKQQGLFQKFSVRRMDGSDLPGGKHYNCRYFVIDMDHDQHAPAALQAYAAACQSTHPKLSEELAAEFGAVAAPAGVPDFEPDAKRLALELECLLLECKDMAAVSKWWDSSHEALEQHRALLSAVYSAPADAVAAETNVQEPVALLHRYPSKCQLKVEFEDAVTELAEGTYALYTAPFASAPADAVAKDALPPVERDEEMDRTYIPMPGGWEVQTKGKGSTFRICDTKTGERWAVLDKSLCEALEKVAMEVRAAVEVKEPSV